MTVYSLFVAFCVLGLLLILAYVGWWIYIHISPFHVAVNRIPGPKYLPLIGNALDIAGGLDREYQIVFRFKDKKFKTKILAQPAEYLLYIKTNALVS
jgi:hypothetical protein